VKFLRGIRSWWLDIVAMLIAGVIFVVPFVFILLTAAKSRVEAARFEFTLPTEWFILDNIAQVLDARNGILTVSSVAILVIVAAMVAFVLQRRRDRVAAVVTALMLAGLIIPPAIVPTIYVLQSIGLFKTLLGLTLVEVAFLLPFSVLIFRTFMTAIPRELDEAAILDGATGPQLFRHVIFPLLRPAVITVIVVSSVAVYNDFVNPLYFLPGNENATVQLTLYNFTSQMGSRWQLLFTDVLLITIPPLIMFILFQRQIVSGMASGAVKG
jgi:raffinose/stachyose/melibiose transport system permease protein